ncbi:MAG: SUMF1/EgtB/PvdO family nonheme iron enzyme [bacterium]|nr:SUMF1/EgtB/PvdO family nonheme iron enzyme [bacterium]
MRVVISSTPGELEAHRAAAGEVARELGFEPVLPQPPAADDGGGVAQRVREVAGADLLLAIVGWRRGEMPGPELGGDGRRSWTAWEVDGALRHARPVVVLMAGDGWPMKLRDDDPVARAWLLDFRGGLHSLATLFAPEPDDATPLAGFRELVRRELARHLPGAADASRPEPGVGPSGLKLRRRPPPELPERPYPVLLPYTHPQLLAGREREIAELARQLRLPVPILGLYAASGAGKSSVLLGGLIPALRDAGQPVAVVRHPAEPGLAGRLIGDLLAADDHGILGIDDQDRDGFVDRLLAARKLAGAPPVLVLDQFEDLLRRPETRRARAVAGALLAASVQHQPGCDGPLCHWLLVYRQEFHGELFRWLGDALREARSLGLAGVGTLPHDLSGPERFHARALPPLGAPPAAAGDPVDAASRVFKAAIERPLGLRTAGGDVRYPWRFSDDGAARLARAFGEARLAQPQAPLVPELQVVLAHLLDRAAEPTAGGEAAVTVPEEPGELIGQALDEHLGRALARAFPGPSEDARLGRTRALLALRELADARGRRDQGLVAETLAQAIGREGREVLEKLATPQTRLVVAEQQGGEWVYVLAHDRMAEVLVRLVDEEGGHAGLGVDAELLGLRRFVGLKSELYAAGELEQATEVPKRTFRGIEEHAVALLWGEERQRWWAACRARRRAEQRRMVLRRGIAALIVSALVVGVWSGVDWWARRQALFDEVGQGEPETAFAAVNALLVAWKADPEELRGRLRERPQPLEVLERGIGGVTEDDRHDAVMRVAELALPLITDDEPEDPVRIASLVWALDFFAPKDDRTRQLRDRALEPLRRQRPPPALPGSDDPNWADVPAGTFRRWWREVKISPFRMMTHEVTNGEYRRLFPGRARGPDELPATGMTWYEAYTYAAWIGGRLPTEAEWEYAARAGCDFACKRDGSEASVDEVAWSLENAADPETGESAPSPVGLLKANAWGFFDIYGNVAEIVADWGANLYPEENQVDPSGPTDSPSGYRVVRGGSAWWPAREASTRTGIPAGERYIDNGLRVVLLGAP